MDEAQNAIYARLEELAARQHNMLKRIIALEQQLSADDPQLDKLAEKEWRISSALRKHKFQPKRSKQ